MQIMLSPNANTDGFQEATVSGILRGDKFFDEVSYYYENVVINMAGNKLFEAKVDLPSLYMKVLHKEYIDNRSFKFLIFDELDYINFRMVDKSTGVEEIFSIALDQEIIANDLYLKVIDFKLLRTSYPQKDIYPIINFKQRAGDTTHPSIQFEHNDFDTLVIYRYQHYIFHLMALSSTCLLYTSPSPRDRG